LESYPKAFQEAVCSGDIYTFATDPASPAVNQQVRQLADVGIGWDDFARPQLLPEHLRQAFSWLQRFTVVLVQEELHPLGVAMLDFTFGDGVEQLGGSVAELIQSASFGAPDYKLRVAGQEYAPVQERVAAARAMHAANKTLVAAIRRANAYDVLVHGEARRIFKRNAATMMALV
jgi:hypothetical protein